MLTLTPYLSVLHTAWGEAQMESHFQESSSAWTIFAPNDTALNNLAPDLDLFLADLELVSLLGYHVVEGLYDEATLRALLAEGTLVLTTLFGSDVIVTQVGDDIRVNGVTLSLIDIKGSQGVIYVLNQTLEPLNNGFAIFYVPEHSRTLTALTLANRFAVLTESEDWTMFAPTNSAWLQFEETGELDLIDLNLLGLLGDVIDDHLVAGVWTKETLQEALTQGPLTLETRSGKTLVVTEVDERIFMNGVELSFKEITTRMVYYIESRRF